MEVLSAVVVPSPGPAGDPTGAPSELPAGPGPAFPAEVKTEPPAADHTPAFFDKRPAKEVRITSTVNPPRR